MNELLPCPFCGHDAERLTLDEPENEGGDVICCTRCQASSRVEFGRKETVVEAWNRRAHASGGVAAIAFERRRQITAEGWTPEHDDAHRNGELAKAAGCYAWIAGQSDELRSVFRSPPPTWPDGWGAEWWKIKDRRSDLVRAGALIAAEIDRIDRAVAARLKDGKAPAHG